MENEYSVFSDEQLLNYHRIASEKYEMAQRRYNLESTRLEKILAVMRERGLLDE